MQNWFLIQCTTCGINGNVIYLLNKSCLSSNTEARPKTTKGNLRALRDDNKQENDQKILENLPAKLQNQHLLPAKIINF